jgi:Putative transposase
VAAARVGITAVLHTWGSALTHHPHVHMIVPGGGLSEDGGRWISVRPHFLVPVKVLSRLFRERLLAMLTEAHAQDRLAFFGEHAGSPTNEPSRASWHRCVRSNGWSTPRTRSPGLSRCCAISRAIRTASPSSTAVSSRPTTTASPFRWKDYRVDGPERWKTMTLSPHEFVRRFLMHVLPKGFHRIRHYGCSPTATAPPTSPAPASCSALCPTPSSPRRRRPQRRTSRACCPAPARAAAAA